jgi:ABC-type antimicrobial peptide transport system permease subunit
MFLALHVDGPPLQMLGAARREVARLDPGLPISEVKTMEQRLGQSLAVRRYSTALLGIFAAAALVLTAVGIYGVISYSVAERTREMGVRMALGAGAGSILALILKRGMGLAAAGTGLGLAGALLAARLMRGLLFQVSATDPWTLAGVSGVLLASALLACYIPARRATRVDPVQALRYE